jgi:hypothetical protein
MGYQMLAGRLPFEGESFQDIIVQHVTKEPAPLAALVPDAPADLAAAVMRCLAKEPGKRWPDALQLRTALDVTDDDHELPEHEDRIDGVGFWGAAGLWGIAMAGLGFYLFPDQREGWPWWAGPAALTVLLAAPGAEWIRQARAKGLPWSLIWRRVLSSPRWWPLWWPRRWRRLGDVWDRLPRVLRWSRIVACASLAWMLLLSVPVFMILTSGGWNEIERSLGFWAAYAILFGPILVLPSLGLVLSLVLPPVWMAQNHPGIDRRVFGRMAFMSTSRLSLWRKPAYATWLLPPPVRAVVARSAEPRSPDEYAAAIRDLVGQLPSGTQATVSEAADAARQLLGTLAALDAEIAKLAQDADPQELEAVEAKLRALGPEAADEGEMRREKRALLVHQRALLRRLDERVKELTEQRSRLADLMRTMWLQVANLRAEAAHDTLAVTEISGRIKVLCTEIDAHVKAAETVRLEIR